MNGQRLRWTGAAILWAAALTSAGAAPPPDTDRDVRAMAERIDHHVSARWAATKTVPSSAAEDAEFLRRLSIDLVGRVPSVAEARAFLADAGPDKRVQLANRWLASPRYAIHFGSVFRNLMLPEAGTNFQVRFLAPGFEKWLREQLARNAAYDQIVRDLLTAQLGPETTQNLYAYGMQQPSSPAAYYLAKELRPENLASSTARLFLGFRLECAQCHDHPFAEWKREQFWGLAAFFAGMRRQDQGEGFFIPQKELMGSPEIGIPGSERVVQATFPDGTEPRFKFKVSTRTTLADWMTSPENPYFARATVNRLWAYFFGTGLVDPVDEMVGGESACSHPELLSELARDFVAHQFDLKYLMRVMTASKTYQLSSLRTHASQDDPRLFARAALRGMSPEQLFDSVALAVGYREPRINYPPGVIVYGGGLPRAEFLARFANHSDRPTETQTSILQALMLMNGRFIADATSISRSETLAAVLDAPFLDTAGKLETLYLATLSRRPKPNELAKLIPYVESGGVSDDKADMKTRTSNALADVLWALLNSGEFFLNH